MPDKDFFSDHKKDVLDILREWIKLQHDTSHGSIKPEIFWENHVPVKIEINQGDKRTLLTSKTNFD